MQAGVWKYWATCWTFWPIFITLVLLHIYFVYSSVSIYRTFTRFIRQCPAWLAVSTSLHAGDVLNSKIGPMCIHFSAYMHTSDHTCSLHISACVIICMRHVSAACGHHFCEGLLNSWFCTYGYIFLSTCCGILLQDLAVHTRISPNQRDVAIRKFVSVVNSNEKVHMYIL